MTIEYRIPDAETRARSVHKLKKICRELEAVELMLDEAIALVDRDLREQRLARLQKRASVLAAIAPDSLSRNAQENCL